MYKHDAIQSFAPTASNATEKHTRRDGLKYSSRGTGSWCVLEEYVKDDFYAKFRARNAEEKHT